MACLTQVIDVGDAGVVLDAMQGIVKHYLVVEQDTFHQDVAAFILDHKKTVTGRYFAGGDLLGHQGANPDIFNRLFGSQLVRVVAAHQQQLATGIEKMEIILALVVTLELKTCRHYALPMLVCQWCKWCNCCTSL